MNDHIVNALGVHKIYRTAKLEVRALNGVDLQVRRGEMVAIMGPSGCGKTTLLNCLAGLDDIDHGEVHLDGLDIHQLSDRKRSDHRSRKMGFIFQFFNLLPVLDAVENVEFPLLVAGVGPSEAHRAAADMLDQVGLADRLDHKPAELSAGQQQRVAIARALVNGPIIVWADEPTGNLDSDTSAEVMDLLVRLNKERDQTLVMVTHDAAVSERAHRVVQMSDGSILTETSNDGNGAGQEAKLEVGSVS